MKGTWDTGHEQNFLDHAHLLGWDSGLVQDLVGHYTRVAQGTLGEITPALIGDFHHTFAARLPQEERDRLVQWNVDRSPRWPAGPPPPLVPFRGKKLAKSRRRAVAADLRAETQGR